MTRKSKTGECIEWLMKAGIAHADARQLRSISITLHHWHEGECGDSDNAMSWSITRGRKTADGFEYDEDGAPFKEVHYHRGDAKAHYYAMPDREKTAKRRLASIMKRYPHMAAYIQGDPRGAALYILRPGDVPEGADVSSCYNRGVAVYK